MSSEKASDTEDDVPAAPVAASLLYRLRAAALPPMPFASRESESKFIERYYKDGALAHSIALLIGGVALFGFFIAHAIEGAEHGSNRWAPQATRLIITTSLIGLAYLLLSKKKWFLIHFKHVGLIGPTVAIIGVAILPFTMHANASNPDFPFSRFFLSLATTIWICFAFGRVSRVAIFSTSAAASAALTGFALHHNYGGAYFSSMHLVVAIWAGWALSVLIEKRERQTFMSQERMAIESNAMAENIERTDIINEMQAEALQTIAHDIRQPLLSLGLYSDIMGSQYENMPDIKEFAIKIRSCLTASENSIAIVENVLYSASIASQLSVKEITLARPLTMLEVIFSPILSATGIRLELPTAREQSISIWTNEHALNEILLNIVSNANKHAWHAGMESAKRISVMIKEVDDQLIELMIVDNGRGISTHDLDHIFEKGFQADPRPHGSGGSGFGLAIVRGLVNKLPGHTISVQSTLTLGTTFRIGIPRIDPQPQDD